MTNASLSFQRCVLYFIISKVHSSFKIVSKVFLDTESVSFKKGDRCTIAFTLFFSREIREKTSNFERIFVPLVESNFHIP